MKPSRLHIFRGAFIAASFLIAQLAPAAETPPPIQWQRVFGGSGDEVASDIAAAGDGGFVLLGNSSSEPSGNKTSPHFGGGQQNGGDYWLVKVDSQGNKLWDRSYGGSGADQPACVVRTADGGFLLGGSSESDVSGNKETPSFGDFDYWVVKVDAEGNKLWERSYGGDLAEYLSTITPTADGGFLLGGTSKSDVSGNKTSELYGESDCWLVKVDANGNQLWDRSLGGTKADYLDIVRATPDGGFLLAGSSSSGATGNKAAHRISIVGWDYWLVKLDANGNKLWDRSYGGTDNDWDVFGLVVKSDGSALVAGTSASVADGNKSSPNFGDFDCWLVRVDADGNKLWDRSFGGSSFDQCSRIAATGDGGYLVAGISQSLMSGNKSARSFGSSDDWLVKLDADGNKVWDSSYGGSGANRGQTIVPASDGGFLFLGESASGISGNKSEAGFGATDLWLIKLASQPPSTGPTQSAANIVLSWPGSNIFALEKATQLQGPWTNSTTPPVHSNGMNHVTLPASVETSFFRLRTGYGEPARLDALLLDPSGYDRGPSLSRDGLSLYFFADVNWSIDIYFTTRASLTSPWEAPVYLDPINTEHYETYPALSPDGLSLFFSEWHPGDPRTDPRPGGVGGGDIWVALRKSTQDPWQTPVNLGRVVNSPFLEATPSLSGDGLTLFFTSDRQGGLQGTGLDGLNELWMTKRSDASDPFGWGPPVRLGGPVNSSFADEAPSLSDDGRTLYFMSRRPYDSYRKIWVATRSSVLARLPQFGKPLF